MTEDRMHDRLTRAGQDWRRAQTPLALDPATATRASSRLPVYAAAAAAVLAIAGGGWAIGNLGGDQPQPTPPATTLPRPASGVVPWADLPPTHPSIPTHRVSGRPDPQVAAGLRPCSAGDLHVTPSTGAAAGTAYLDLEISGPDDGCRVEGIPQVTLLDHGHRIPVYRSQVGYTDIHPVMITPGPSATLTLGWSASHSCAGVDNDQIQVSLPDGSSFSTPGFGPTSCNPGEPDLQQLIVEPFRQIDTATTHRVGLFESLRTRPAEGRSIELTGSPGQRLEFAVSVVSAQRVVLDPCPDYRIQLYYGDYGLSEEHEYALNCDAIPTRDSQGRPVLLPGRPVELQMFVTAPDTDVPKLLWLLDGVRPDRSHAYGEISVEPPVS